ncbi:DUF7511 domain-containing protein [Halomarina ordinaria]|uniref:DUF7511 domain-containing protein n=1 Tax=Halomarina ordinaria TaxID=3033939 RepID=A0ABD5UB13_9EURY|nr:hypothetical protein [Halomarina sp. PSRA2]
MTDHRIDDAVPSIAEEVQSCRDRGVLLHRIVRPPNAPEECTLYPDDVSAAELPTTWLTASEGAFVSLADAR